MAKLLVPTPYVVPEKNVKKKAPGTKRGLRHKGTSNVTSEDSKTHSSTKDDEEEEEEEEIHPPCWGKNEEDGLHTRGGRGIHVTPQI